ncbi:MAG: hypothetical protein U0X76_01885 [Bacteroidia bacterium]
MKLSHITLLFLLFNGVASTLLAQFPDTDIMLYRMEKSGSGNIEIFSGENITNRKGYDNQPVFSPAGDKIIYVSISEKDSTQSDLMEYDIATGNTKQLTKTKESEYSPTFSSDGKKLFVVHVDVDSGQRLYSMTWPELNNLTRIENSDSVGYFGLLDSGKVAMFLISEPPRMVILDLSTHKSQFICNEPGRCMRTTAAYPGQMLYIDKSDSLHWFLKSCNTTDFTKKIIAEMPGLTEDFTVLNDGTLLCGMNGTLYRLSNGKKDWLAVHGAKEEKFPAFKRIATDRMAKRMAIVISK